MPPALAEALQVGAGGGGKGSGENQTVEYLKGSSLQPVNGLLHHFRRWESVQELAFVTNSRRFRPNFNKSHACMRGVSMPCG